MSELPCHEWHVASLVVRHRPEAAAALGDYLTHSERIVLAVYARRLSESNRSKA